MSTPPGLDAILGATDGVAIPPQSQGPGPIALSKMYRDAAMQEQESLAPAVGSPKRRPESEMLSAVPKMAKTSVSQTHVSTPAAASPAGHHNAGNGGRCFRCVGHLLQPHDIHTPTPHRTPFFLKRSTATGWARDWRATLARTNTGVSMAKQTQSASLISA